MHKVNRAKPIGPSKPAEPHVDPLPPFSVAVVSNSLLALNNVLAYHGRRC